MMQNIKQFFNSWLFGAVVANPTWWYILNWDKMDTERVYEWGNKIKKHVLTGYVPLAILFLIWLRYLYVTIREKRNQTNKMDTKVNDTTNNSPTANNSLLFFNHPGWAQTNPNAGQAYQPQQTPVLPSSIQQQIAPSAAYDLPRSPSITIPPIENKVISQQIEEMEKLTKALTSISHIMSSQTAASVKPAVMPPFQPYVPPVQSPPVNVFNTLHVAPPSMFTKKTKVAGWIDKMETFLAVNNITQHKKETMWSYIDEECVEILKKATYDSNPEVAYSELKQNLRELFGAEEPSFLTRLSNFQHRDQLPGENVRVYGLALDHLARKAFGDQHKELDSIIMDRFLAGLRNPDIRIKFIIDRPINLTRLIESAALLEKTLNKEPSTTLVNSSSGQSHNYATDQNKNYANYRQNYSKNPTNNNNNTSINNQPANNYNGRPHYEHQNNNNYNNNNYRARQNPPTNQSNQTQQTSNAL